VIHTIGESAGKVWRFLNEKGEANMIQLFQGVDADWNLILSLGKPLVLPVRLEKV
jgi:hypothetical protein